MHAISAPTTAALIRSTQTRGALLVPECRAIRLGIRRIATPLAALVSSPLRQPRVRETLAYCQRSLDCAGCYRIAGMTTGVEAVGVGAFGV
jgi:hypothetical protein